MSSKEKLEPGVIEVLMKLDGIGPAYTSCPSLARGYRESDPTPVVVEEHGKRSGRFFLSRDFKGLYFESCTGHLDGYIKSHEEITYD